MLELNHTLDQVNVTDIYRAFHPTVTKYTHFSIVHVTFSRVEHMIGHKTNLSKFKKFEIIKRPSRWQRSEPWRSLSSLQIHQKYIYMWRNYRTPTECWQKTSDFPKSKKLPTYLGRAKEKRKNRDKRIGTGPAPLGGSCEGGKVSTRYEAPSLAETEGGGGEASEPWRRVQQQGCRGQSRQIPVQRISANEHSPAWETCLLTHGGGWGLRAEALASEVRCQGEDWGWLCEHSLKGLVHHS